MVQDLTARVEKFRTKYEPLVEQVERAYAIASKRGSHNGFVYRYFHTDYSLAELPDSRSYNPEEIIRRYFNAICEGRNAPKIIDDFCCFRARVCVFSGDDIVNSLESFVFELRDSLSSHCYLHEMKFEKGERAVIRQGYAALKKIADGWKKDYQPLRLDIEKANKSRASSKQTRRGKAMVSTEVEFTASKELLAAINRR